MEVKTEDMTVTQSFENISDDQSDAEEFGEAAAKIAEGFMKGFNRHEWTG